MATLLLGGAGGLVGGALFGPLGAIAGRALGALGGAVADAALSGGGRSQVVQGARLSDLDVMTSNAGAPIPRIYGRVRVAGQVIWGTRLEEVVSTQVQSTGGKSARTSTRTTTLSYSYFANFAVALCEGPVTRIGRIWADGKPLDATAYVIRAYLGSEDQLPDPWIEAKEGSGMAPAYRGLAYLVFERMPLAKFGNRLPQITVEVERAVGRLERHLKAVTLIPGSTEFGYEPGEVRRVYGPGSYDAENRHVATARSDFAAALDHLQALCPSLERVSLVVAWFGDDLRAGSCTVRPKVERLDKSTWPNAWMVNGLPRLLASAASRHQGVAAYGGTPSDSSVLHAIADLKARGLKVTLNPFVMMDIPAGNGRPDPWTGATDQPAYPWRGRITCDPAPGRAGSADGTASARTQVAHLFGSAARTDFGVYAGQVYYFGPAEWSLRRMVLHYAHLAALAGGVEAFLIGSEFAALTRMRAEDGSFPAVAAFAALAGDVKAILGAGTKVSYAADWTEYGAQLLPGGDLRFPLDGLWSSSAIDFVGLDYYPPLSDWRAGATHLDRAQARSIHDPAYLNANLKAGEAFDWFYADEAARSAQARTAITDGVHAEPWVFRQKDLWSWWSKAHHERIGGVRSASPTAFVPNGKPIRLMEAGCPAVDKGSNRPSVFPDAKSAEGGYPPFSDRRRDDLIQRRALEAVLSTFDADFGAGDADNPPRPGGGRMVEEGCVFLWTWDARPYPEFPLATDLWADGVNWQTGHWLNGRLGTAPLADLVAQLCADHGVDEVEAGSLPGVVDGYLVDQPMSARSALEPLGRAFGFDAVEQEGVLAFRPRGGPVVASLTEDDLVVEEGAAPLALTRAQESELPVEVGLTFIDGASDYRTATVASRRLSGASLHVARTELSVVASAALMGRAADVWLQDLWAGRETATFALPPSHLGLTAGDVVEVTCDDRTRLLEITRIEDTQVRAVSARSIEPDLFEASLRADSGGTVRLPAVSGPPDLQLLDLPLLEAADPVPLQHLAAFVSPWPGALAVWRSSDGASFEAIAALSAPATLGQVLQDLPTGPAWRFDRSSRLLVELNGGLLQGLSEAQVLEGGNLLALIAEGRESEVIQFTGAELLEGRTYALTGLLRGQAGTEAAGAATWPAGTRLVLLDRTLAALASGPSAYGRSFIYRVGRADRDHGDEEVSEVSGAVGGRALRPLSPVHLAARRTGEGIRLTWVRRSRVDGDFDAADTPLAEEVEAYRLDILDGESVRRSVTVSTPEWLYPAASEVADFGRPLSSITFRVAQVSAVLGPGAPVRATRAV